MARLSDLVVAIGGNTKNLDKELGKAMRKVKSFGKSTKQLGKDLSMNVTAPIAALGFTAVRAFQEQAKAIAQVEAGLQSTAGQVGYTSEQLQSMASNLQKTTLFGDEEILKDATAQLLTFTNISGEQFERTQKAALDLATRLDGDLKSASIQLGKALNDPIANLSALSRSGIQFSAEQKEVIKSLTESGRLAEAQTIILDELNKQYGGSAEAAAKAEGGFTQLANAFGDLQEQFGAILVEVLQPVIEYLRTLIERFQRLSPETKKMIVNMSLVAAAVGPLVFIFGQLAQSMYAIGLAAKAMMGPIGLAVVAFTALMSAVSLYGLSAKDADDEVGKLKRSIEGLSDAEAKRFEENRLRELTKELEEERKIYDALKNQVLTGDAVEQKVHRQAVERHRMKVQGLEETISAIQHEISNKEMAAMADERLAALAGDRATAEAAVADEVERQRVNLELMLTAQEKAKAAAERMAKAFQAAGVSEAIQPMRPAGAPAGLMTGPGVDLGFGPLSENVNRDADEALNALDMVNAKTNAIAENIKSNLTSAFSSLFRGLIDGTQSFGDFMKQILTDLLVQLASMAAAFLLISTLLPGSNIAMGGFGAFLKGGLTPFADGGIVSGPTAALVGEYAGARTNPEVIAPLDKLQAMIQGAGGGNVTVTGRLSGRDILLSSERSNFERNRVRGF